MLAPPIASAQRTDILVLENGDHVTGEIKNLRRGILEFKTDNMGTLKVEWHAVQKLESDKDFDVGLADGVRLFGTLGADADEHELKVVGTQTHAPSFSEVTDISPLKGTVLSRVDGSVSVGYTFAQSNATSTWNASAKAGYRTRNYLTAFGLSSYFNAQDQSDTVTRNTLDGSLTRFLTDNWLVLGLAQFLQSSQLGVDLRTTAGGAAGRHVIQSNSMTLTPVGGVVYSHSIFANSTSNQNEILALGGLQYDVFTFGSHKTDFSTAVYVLPSLTESGHYRLDLDSDVRVELFHNFYWNFNLYDNFDNDPPPGGAKNDFGVSSSIGWSF